MPIYLKSESDSLVDNLITETDFEDRDINNLTKNLLLNYIQELEGNLDYLAEEGHCREIWFANSAQDGLEKDQPELQTTPEYDEIYEKYEAANFLYQKVKVGEQKEKLSSILQTLISQICLHFH
jgi:hypothetical protein